MIDNGHCDSVGVLAGVLGGGGIENFLRNFLSFVLTWERTT
jgi:hypothetical protein